MYGRSTLLINKSKKKYCFLIYFKTIGVMWWGGGCLTALYKLVNFDEIKKPPS